MSRLKVAFASGFVFAGSVLSANAQERPVDPVVEEQVTSEYDYPIPEDDIELEWIVPEVSGYFSSLFRTLTGWSQPEPQVIPEEDPNEEPGQNQISIGSGILSVGDLVAIEEDEPEDDGTELALDLE